MAIFRFLFFFLFSIGVIHASSAQEREYMPGVTLNIEEVKEEVDSVYIYVDIMPQFPGGKDKLKKLLTENIRFPVVSAEYGMSATVFIEFVVNADGSIRDIKVLDKSFTRSFLLDEIVVVGYGSKGMVERRDANLSYWEDAENRIKKECLRVIKMMPQWQPGKLYGSPVAVSLVLPVSFRIHK